jgi:eukaryotic-like serine/threonine-protein kinase
VVGAIVLIAAFWIAHYNWKAGRGDLRGATRLGIYCAGMSLAAWFLRAHHVSTQNEQVLIGQALASAAYVFVQFWILYLALEPWVRRYWPQTLITWSRVLAGKLHDPLVGRDMLFALLFGMIYLLYILGFEYLRLRGGSPGFSDFGVNQLGGLLAFGGLVTANLLGEIGTSLVFFMTLFLLRAVVRKQWLAGAIWIAGWTAFSVISANYGGFPGVLYFIGYRALLYTVLVVIMLRFGFFAFLITIFVIDCTLASFFTTDFSAWYGQSSAAMVILLSAMALWGFRLAVSENLSPARSV